MFPLSDDGRKLEDILVRIKRTRRLQLGRDIVLPWPWNPSRLRSAMEGFGPNGDWGPWKAESNHQVVLWEPIRIGWVAQRGSLEDDVRAKMLPTFDIISVEVAGNRKETSSLRNEISLLRDECVPDSEE